MRNKKCLTTCRMFLLTFFMTEWHKKKPPTEVSGLKGCIGRVISDLVRRA